MGFDSLLLPVVVQPLDRFEQIILIEVAQLQEQLDGISLVVIVFRRNGVDNWSLVDLSHGGLLRLARLSYIVGTQPID